MSDIKKKVFHLGRCKKKKWHNHLGLIMWVFIPHFVSSDYTRCWNSNVFSFFHQPECSDAFWGGADSLQHNYQPTSYRWINFSFEPSPPRRHFQLLQRQHHGRHHLQQQGPEAIRRMSRGTHQQQKLPGKLKRTIQQQKNMESRPETRLILDPTDRQAKLQITAFIQSFFKKSVNKSNFESLSASAA